MSKSPINFFGGIAGVAAGIRGRKNSRKFKKFSTRVNRLENQMKTVMRDRNKNYDMSAGMEEPGAVGGITDATINTGAQSAQNLANDQLSQQGLAPLGGFGAGTMDAASAMFGDDIPGSFDKNMGSPLNINKQKER
jgi:hypothetical protein